MTKFAALELRSQRLHLLEILERLEELQGLEELQPEEPHLELEEPHTQDQAPEAKIHGQRFSGPRAKRSTGPRRESSSRLLQALQEPRLAMRRIRSLPLTLLLARSSGQRRQARPLGSDSTASTSCST